MKIFLQWIKFVFIILFVFFAGIFIGTFLSNLLGLWDEPYSGFLAAILVVGVGFKMAPIYKMQIATCILILGTLIAWQLLEPSSYPENYGNKSYQLTHIPFLYTLLGGILGWLGCFIIILRIRNFKQA